MEKWRRRDAGKNECLGGRMNDDDRHGSYVPIRSLLSQEEETDDRQTAVKEHVYLAWRIRGFIFLPTQVFTCLCQSKEKKLQILPRSIDKKNVCEKVEFTIIIFLYFIHFGISYKIYNSSSHTHTADRRFASFAKEVSNHHIWWCSDQPTHPIHTSL